MNENFILKKDINWSLFNEGFAIPETMQPVISMYLNDGSLKHGEKREIKILLNDKTYNVSLTSINFDQKKYPNHKDIWQIRYSSKSAIAMSLKNIFQNSYKLLSKFRNDHKENEILNSSDAEKESIVLYATDIKEVFYIETIFNSEISGVKNKENEIVLENLFDLSTLTDNETALVEKYRLTKIRKLNRSIGNYLKKLYNFRCQICGKNIGLSYGVNIVECHHINYFVKSLNNDVDNLLIVCPNHHRIIHAANPTFDNEKKIYHYQNGYEEGLKLNLHL